MTRYQLVYLFVAVSIVAALGHQAPAQQIVYDGLSSSQALGGVLNIETGASVQLAGSARIITRIDLLTSSSVSSEQYRVFLDTVDQNGFPSAIIWTSPPQTRTGTGDQVISVNVPSITVPDRVAWILQRLNPPGGTQMLSRYTTAPAVGTPIIDFDRDGGPWFDTGDNSNASFGAKIYAIVPEPATACLLLPVGLSFLMHRRRSSSAP